MPGDMNVTNRMIIGVNRELGKTDRLDGHKPIEKTTDQAAGEALLKLETPDVFANFRNRSLPQPEKFVPMPSLEQFEKDSEAMGSVKEEVNVLNEENDAESMSSVKQEVETPKASRMGSAEKTGRLLAANLVELTKSIQSIFNGIFGKAIAAQERRAEVRLEKTTRPEQAPETPANSGFEKMETGLFKGWELKEGNNLDREAIREKGKELLLSGAKSNRPDALFIFGEGKLTVVMRKEDQETKLEKDIDFIEGNISHDQGIDDRETVYV
jgi:hypothetical protein